MITCCLNCTSRHQACHDTCEKYKAEKKDLEERKAFVHEKRLADIETALCELDAALNKE